MNDCKTVNPYTGELVQERAADRLIDDDGPVPLGAGPSCVVGVGLGAPLGAWPLVAAMSGARGYRSPTRVRE